MRYWTTARVALMAATAAAWGQPYKSRLGVEIDAFGDGSRSRPFVDHARLFRPCTVAGGSARVAVDGDGWPTADADCVMFDVRAIPAWAPPIDDPAQFQPDWSGVWSLSFEGRADLRVSSGGATISGLTYDAERNLTRGRLTVNAGSGLLILSFSNTRRTPEVPVNSGFRLLRLIRPGYPAESGQIYTHEFLRSFRPFQILRYMDFTATNSVVQSAMPEVELQWRDRRLLTDATQQAYGGKAGVAWEYAALLANQTGADMWINIPASASDDYVRQLALLILSRLNRSLKVYVEHGNEVWNPLFANSYNFNRNRAQAEVNAGGSDLNYDNLATSNTDTFARRRHLRRVIEAVGIFRQVQTELDADAEEAPGDFDNWRIRGIYAWWTIFPDQYRTTLNWAKEVYGDVNQHLYAIASTHYFNVARAAATDTPERLIEVMSAASDNGAGNDARLRQIASDFGLRHTIYEGGPDVGGGSTVNVANRILANRLPAMKDLLLRDIATNWFERGGAEYMYFAHCGACSRYGCWGAAEDIVKLDTPKMQALRELSGVLPAPVVDAINDSEDPQPGAIVVLSGLNFASAAYDWSEASLDGRTLPTMLGGFEVRFQGKNAAVRSVSPEQASVILPPDLGEGDTEVEVSTANGVWKGSITINR